MKWVRKTICIFLGLAMISSTALAEIPNYTVIIGNKSFALKYANDEKNIKEIRDALKKNTGKIIIKTKNKWFENNGEIFHELSSLPRVIYTDENGNRCEYKEGNGDKIKGGILSIELVNSNTIRIKFTQALDKQWISNRENFLINGVELTEEDIITYNEEEGYVQIKLHKKVKNSVELSLKNIKNLYGEILHEEFKKKIVPKSESSSTSGGSSYSGSSHSGGNSNSTINVESIVLNETELKMRLTSKYQLTTQVLPLNATNKALTWKSSNTSVATVDKNGKVVATGVGISVITVESTNGKTAKCNVTVLPIPVDSVTLQKEKSIELGEKAQLVAKIYPSNATNKNLTWTSSNFQIISVDNDGILMAKELGTVTITAESNNNKVATCVVKSVPKNNTLVVNIINNKAVINIVDITESEKFMNLKIMNKVNGNLELIQDYELNPDKMEIKLELNPGVYTGEINIGNSRRFKIKTFSID
ncbi:Ig-like domain-containing protein [Oceanirhabdus seepicola]|uniref:Ig domain-containing protein n=1 Tax=Oceanirhabdus seepicola TaxID=2828781 RepID=A0A9J6P319_9CLOT|nr:Ig-like domain-containing protein [Oceanirhabdus seepicola]MCM1990285.1 Ig domain-containing protein [Oceanirhabdus seepicola]